MSADWDKFIQDIMSRVDLADFISQYTSLRKRGSRAMGLCPFHGDKDPSFSVSTDQGLWHCFGCKKGGNIFTFVMEREGMTFVEAAEFLADRYNIEMPSKSKQKTSESPKKAILEINREAEIFFAKFIRSDAGEPFREYLKQRKITKEIVERFNIGAAPDSWDLLSNHLRKKGYSDDLIFKAGLAKKGERGIYDTFRKRLIIPIRDHLDRTVAFGGRVIDKGEPKYLNSPESEIFQKSDLLFAYPLAKDEIQKNGYVIVMEGYTDVMRAHQKGFGNAVAVMGTALSEKHIKRLGRLTQKIFLAFDSDPAGIQAAVRSAQELIKSEFLARVVRFDDGFDPEEYLVKKGAKAFQEKLDSAEEGIWFLVNLLIPAKLPQKQDERIAILLQIIEQVRIHPHKSVHSSILKEVALKLNLPWTTVREVYKKFEDSGGSDREEIQKEMKAEEDKPDNIETELIRYAVNFPQVRAKLMEHVSVSEIKYPLYKKLISALFNSEKLMQSENLQHEPEIVSNSDFSKLVSEMLMSLEDGQDYSFREFSVFISWFKKHTIEEIHRHNRLLLEKASRENDYDLVNRIHEENKILIQLKKKYTKIIGEGTL
jgi:DNA primase